MIKPKLITMIVFASYPSIDEPKAVVEFQRVSVEKDEFIETWNKVPTGNRYNSDTIRAMMNNGYKWTVIRHDE